MGPSYPLENACFVAASSRSIKTQEKVWPKSGHLDLTRKQCPTCLLLNCISVEYDLTQLSYLCVCSHYEM